MRTINNLKFKTRSGEPIHDGTSKESLDVLFALKTLIDNSSYKSFGEQRQALAIYSKLEDANDLIELEDSEVEFLLKYAQEYTPFLNGTVFAPLFAELEG